MSVLTFRFAFCGAGNAQETEQRAFPAAVDLHPEAVLAPCARQAHTALLGLAGFQCVENADKDGTAEGRCLA